MAAIAAGPVASAGPFVLSLFLSFTETPSLQYFCNHNSYAVLGEKRCETIFTEGSRENVQSSFRSSLSERATSGQAQPTYSSPGSAAALEADFDFRAPGHLAKTSC